MADKESGEGRHRMLGGQSVGRTECLQTATPEIRYRIHQGILAHKRGWALTPLRGKIPILKAWTHQPFPEHSAVLPWLRTGNIGLRTGSASRDTNGCGLLIIDVDPRHGGDVAPLNLPETVTVVTGSGGRHYYFRLPLGMRLGNTAGKLGPGIDTKSDGGQVVFVGSTHPDTGKRYDWLPGCSPDDVVIAELPADLSAKLSLPKHLNLKHVSRMGTTGTTTAYGRAALSAEVERVRSAPEGNRNEQLNRSSFALGRLVGGGVLDESRAVDGLLWAARETCLSDDEAIRTIRSGMAAGLDRPKVPR